MILMNARKAQIPTAQKKFFGMEAIVIQFVLVYYVTRTLKQ